MVASDPFSFTRAVAFERNLGLVSPEELERLSNCLVAIAGCGGAGGAHALTLARLGVGRFRITDPDTFSLANFNRQVGASMATIGRNKAVVTAEQIQSINPHVRVDARETELDGENAAGFVRGADLVIDGIDFFSLPARRQLFSAAWEASIPAMTAAPLGFSGTLHVFAPGGMSFDDYFDLRDGQSKFDQLTNFILGLAPAALQRPYVDLRTVDLTSGRGPSSIVGTQLAACLVGAEAIRILLKRSPLRLAPRYLQFDAYRQKLRNGRLPNGNRSLRQRVKRALAVRYFRRIGWDRVPGVWDPFPRPAARFLIGKDSEDAKRKALEALLTAAGQAPSGDNTQPWRFEVNPQACRIRVRLDPSRDPSPLNAGQRMARIALGAVIENLVRAARLQGWEPDFEENTPASTTLSLRGTPREHAVDETLFSRVVNRRVYEGGEIEPSVLARLQEGAKDLDGITTHWILARDRLFAFAKLIGEADGILMAEPSLREALFDKVRFDREPKALVEEGLSLSSLEMSAVDRLTLESVTRVPDRLFQLMGARRRMAARTRRLVESSSGLCLIAAPDSSELGDLLVGGAMQRAWLALTREGLAVQPMMALLGLESISDHGQEKCLVHVTGQRLAGLRARLRTLAPEIGPRRPAFLMRFGFAKPPSGRTGRRPLCAVTSLIGPEQQPFAPPDARSIAAEYRDSRSSSGSAAV